jgi:hypothetical protein
MHAPKANDHQPRIARCAESEERPSFLKKRSKKLLFLRRSHLTGQGLQASAGADIKVFCFFSSEKKTFP